LISPHFIERDPPAISTFAIGFVFQIPIFPHVKEISAPVFFQFTSPYFIDPSGLSQITACPSGAVDEPRTDFTIVWNVVHSCVPYVLSFVAINHVIAVLVPQLVASSIILPKYSPNTPSAVPA
jgi:hypothetical protein